MKKKLFFIVLIFFVFCLSSCKKSCNVINFEREQLLNEDSLDRGLAKKYYNSINENTKIRLYYDGFFGKKSYYVYHLKKFISIYDTSGKQMGGSYQFVSYDGEMVISISKVNDTYSYYFESKEKAVDDDKGGLK